jgi:hypothetical protein
MTKVQKPDSPSVRVRKYWTANPTATNSQVINITGASSRTVSAVRQELVAKGILGPSGIGRPSSFDHSKLLSAAEKDQAEQLVAYHTERDAQYAHEGIAEPNDESERQAREDVEEVEAVLERQLQDMAPEEVRHEMVKLLRNRNTPPPVRVSAAALLEKMRTESADDLGPGIPLTYGDAKHRLTLMMQACGPEMVIECVQEAFNIGSADGSTQAANTPEPSSSSLPPSSPPNNETSLPDSPR